MTKHDFVRAVSARANVTIETAASIIDAALEVAAGAVANGDSLKLNGFGVFEAQQRPEQVRRNPQSGEPMVIAAHKTIRFRAADKLKSEINRMDI